MSHYIGRLDRNETSRMTRPERCACENCAHVGPEGRYGCRSCRAIALSGTRLVLSAL